MTIRLAALAGVALLALSFTAAAPALASTAVTTKPVNVLAGPDTTFGSLLDLNVSTKVSVLWCGPNRFAWCLIRYHGKEGWVRVADIKLQTPEGGPADGPGNKNTTDVTNPPPPNGGPKGNPNSAMPLPASPAPEPIKVNPGVVF